jgi:hypothetical protein
MSVSVQICNQTESQPAELNQLVLNRALRPSDRGSRSTNRNRQAISNQSGLGSLRFEVACCCWCV